MKTLLKLALLTGVLTGLMACIGDKVIIYDPIRVVSKAELDQKLYANDTEAEFRFIPESDWEVCLHEIEAYVGKEIPDTLSSPHWIQFHPDPELTGGAATLPNDTVKLRFKLEPNHMGLHRSAVVKILCGGQTAVINLTQQPTLKSSGRKLANTRLISRISGNNHAASVQEVVTFSFGYYNAGEGVEKDQLSHFNIMERRGNYNNSYNYNIYNDDIYEGLENRRIRIEREASSQGGRFHTGKTVTHLHRGHYVDYSEFGNLKNNWDGTTGDWYHERIEYMNGAPVSIITESTYDRADNDTLTLSWNKKGNLTRIDRYQTHEGKTISRYSYAYKYNEDLVNQTNIDLNWFVLATTSVTSALNLGTLATFEASHLNMAGLMGKRSKHLVSWAAETAYQSDDQVLSYGYDIEYEFDEWGYVNKFTLKRNDGLIGTYTVEYVAPPILNEK